MLKRVKCIWKFPAGYALFLFAALQPAFGQVIGGQVNTYWPVLAVDVCNNRIAVPVILSGVNIGDKILLIQMQGAAIDTSGTAGYGTVTDYGSAGQYEILTIRDVTNNLITFDEIFLNEYDVAGKVQAILVPQYTDVTIGGTLTAPAWNGATGGVVALIASGTVTLNAGIDVSGLGFRGGSVLHHASCYGGGAGFDGYLCQAVDACGGNKGEGIAGVLFQPLGRGAPANGGGGGNDSNTGGGGGSNGAAGGQGGSRINLSPSCSGDFPGLGGHALEYTMPRVFMGGGGGAGDDNSNGASNGGNGGGIVLLRASTLDGNGFSIRARGADASPGIVSLDGAGGGGGGGTILLDIGTLNNTTVSVSGGSGGSVDNGTSADSCFGPGGGGGAGLIWVSGSTTPPVTLETNGQASGTTTGNACSGTNGAASGSNSAVLTGLILPESSVTYVPLSLSLSNDTVVCLGTGAFLQMTATGTGTLTYSWSTGGNTDTTTAYPTGPTTYYATVTDSRGCSLTETLEVDVQDNSVTAYAYPDSIVLGLETVQLTADTAGNEFFIWYPSLWLNDPAVFNPVSIPEDTITYCVIAQGYNGCIDTACVDVLVVIPEPGIHIPSAFTPNNDGINDIWELIIHPCYEIKSVKVWNRWGMPVYDYVRDGATGWNGIYLGKPQPMEVYMYHIVAQCSEREGLEEYRGNLTLVR